MIWVDGRELIWREGMTVADLLQELGDPYPYVAVRIRNRLISRINFDKTKIPKDSEVFLLPLISGG
jgi:thiamine biosynthesis protein ThiS